MPQLTANPVGAELPPPDVSATGGQDFIPSDASTGGLMSQNPQTQTPINQDDSQVTPEEQKQYDDFVTRAKLFINDPREPLNSKGAKQPNGKAPRDVIIDHLNSIDGASAAQAVGRTAAQVVTLITNNATQQGHPYDPDVVLHGSDEIISDLYQIGVAAGVIKNPPPADSDQEAHLLSLAKMYGAQFFGQNMIDSGQNTPALRQQAHQYVMDQMQREAQSGALEKWSPAYQLTPDKLTSFIHRAAIGQAAVQKPGPPTTIDDFAARGHPQLVPPGGAPQPPAPAPDPSQAPPDPSQSAPAPGGQ